MFEMDESMMTPYGPPNPYAHVIQIPNECVGVLIGKGGESIKELQQKTGSKVQIARAECREDPTKRNVFIEGSIQKFEEVKAIIEEHCKERIERRGTVREFTSFQSGVDSRSPSDFKRDLRKDRYESNPNPGPYTYITVSNEYTGVVIGKFGETVRKMQDKYSCQIFIPRCQDPTVDERVIELSGEDPEKVQEAAVEIRRLGKSAMDTNAHRRKLREAVEGKHSASSRNLGDQSTSGTVSPSREYSRRHPRGSRSPYSRRHGRKGDRHSKEKDREQHDRSRDRD